MASNIGNGDRVVARVILYIEPRDEKTYLMLKNIAKQFTEHGNINEENVLSIIQSMIKTMK